MKEMKRSNNTIFKYTMILGAAMSLSACNGLFENIYDAPTETEMEIKEIVSHKSKLLSTQSGHILIFPVVKLPQSKSGKNMKAKYPIIGISPFIAMI